MYSKKWNNIIKVLFVCAIAFIFSISFYKVDAFARESKVPQGVTIGEVDISGLTEQEAFEKANEYIKLYMAPVVELVVDGNAVNVTIEELGYYWKNTEVISEAAAFCEEGNVIERYKKAKDIENSGVKFEFELDVDDEIMTNTINEKCGQYNVPHVNAQLTRVNGTFTISKEQSGKLIDVETNVSEIHNYLLNEWDGKSSFTKEIVMVEDNPVATVEDCERVTDLLGSYTTKFTTGRSNYYRNKNMENGVNLLNGITVCQGETMSVNSYLEPWTESNGWHPAGTYVNGRVEDSLGGGICQVSTTLYGAILNAEIEVAERYAHSMSVGYVPLSMDAALAGTWKDLKITNNTDTPIYIEAIYDPTGKIIFNIYGKETRPANRTVEYVSEVISTIPSSEIVKEDSSLPTGYRAVTSSGHTGYKARLLKKVYVDGVLQSEEVVNKSSYASSPTYVTIGTGTVQEPETPQQAPAQADTGTQTPDTSTQPTGNTQTEPSTDTGNTQNPADSVEETTTAGDNNSSANETGNNENNNNGESATTGGVEG